jgi:hypothetical protein
MDPLSAFPLLPYAQASPAQLAQALFAAKEALGCDYLSIPWPQWYEAFAYFQPLLLLGPDQATITNEGLSAIAQYFNTRHSPPAPIFPPPILPSTLENASGSLLSSTQPRIIKRTYSLRPDVLESLERASFWRRKKRSALVNLAVKQLMATYPESQIPLPTIEV